MDKKCGKCPCMTLFHYQKETGRCRRYGVIVRTETVCLNKKEWKCDCLIDKNDCFLKEIYEY